MKKLLFLLVAFWVSSYTTFAQEAQSDPLLYVGNAIVNYTSPVDKPYLQLDMQIGYGLPDATKNNFSIGFPYGVLYIAPTFSHEKFSISKGYYADRVAIQWQISANEEKIQRIKVYRLPLTQFQDLKSDSNYKTKEGRDIVHKMNLVAILAKDKYEYNDEEVQGGVLYKYIVVAEGVSAFNEKNINYAESIGFRNPTANVSGAITYEGGSPVKDVKVAVEAVGSQGQSVGTAMQFNNKQNGLNINLHSKVKTENLTFQGWIASKPEEVTDYRQWSQIAKFQTDKSGEYTIATNVDVTNKIIKFYLQRGNDDTDHPLSLEIRNNIPTGNVDAQGNDIFMSISDITNQTFVHYTLVLEKDKNPLLYLNGRPITTAYETEVKKYLKDTDKPQFNFVQHKPYSLLNNDERISRIELGKTNFKGYIDEVRLWSRVLSAQEIRKDFKRYINGGEGGLKMYLRMDEGTGEYAYDISRTGYDFHKNNAKRVGDHVVYTNTVKPTKEQLGVFGITGKDGNYTISAIPYAGNGEQFVVSPSLNVHSFNPASQTMFLGEDQPVANQVDFEDISSFVFNGRVVYNTQNVFKPANSLSDPALKNITEIREVGYNQYLVNGSITLNRGHYYYEGETVITNSDGNLEGGTLKEYAVIGVENANLYIDGNIVFDEDNQPIVTDTDGKFSIRVPIGKHKVEVKKQGHIFEFSGRFPEKTNNPENNLFDYYKDQVQERWFVDNTRVTLVGRVVGGRIQSEKPIAFGTDGLYEHSYIDKEDNEQKEVVSSRNNIGKATIVFKGNKNTNNLDKVVETNVETGEYSVDLIPYIYHVKDNGGITISSNSDLAGEFLDSDEELNFLDISEPSRTKYTTANKKEIKSPIAYHFVKNFRYNSPVSLELIKQESDDKVKIGEEDYKLTNSPIAFYTQKKIYETVFEVSQDYINNDVSPNKKVKEFYTEGEFQITNNLEVTGSSVIDTIRTAGKMQYKYKFQAGIPNITQADNFELSMNIQYKPKGSSAVAISNIQDFKGKGIVLGAKPTDGTIFSTVAPDAPDIILRDPPGSNSFASIESGTSISFESSVGDSSSSTKSAGLSISLGPDVTVNTGAVGFLTELDVDVLADVNTGISTTIQTTENNTSIQTYTFNQTISTSDDKDFVGAAGDLYIGNSKNVYYGMIDKLEFSKEVPSYSGTSTEAIPNIPITLKDNSNNDVVLYLGARKTYFIAEQPSATYFIYSQNYILSTLIPQFESLAKSLDGGKKPDPSKDYQSANFYRKQVDLWKKIIQDSERQKYLALNDKEEVKKGLNAIVNKIDDGHAYKENLRKLLNREFFVNRSFDAGVGEFTSSYTTTAIEAKSYDKTVDIDKGFAAEIGGYINGVGRSASFSTNFNSSLSDTDTSTEEKSTTIAYTLKDPDKFNAISVDVVNMFDGSGAVFITKGGFTSCPYEEAVVSEFYKHSGYDSKVVGEGGEKLSDATVSIYESTITADKTELTDIPESENAVFNVKVKNMSPTQESVEYILYVENSSLGGAETNISQKGIPLFLSYDETVSVPIIISKNSSSSVYNYDGIKVYLGDPCEDLDDFLESNGTSLLELSVTFKKSCSKVAISAPETNYVFNNAEAFSEDVNGNITSKVVPVTFTDFNTNFAGFKKIDLQYRNANSPSWTKFKSYYGSAQLMNDASDADGIVIGSETEFTFNWDVVKNKVADGIYEIRAVSYCTDDYQYESDIVRVVVNLTAPVLFGTPEPTDGILDIGDNIMVRFNEVIKEGDLTNIVIRGLQNQQEVDHSVSVTLDGSANQIELPQQIFEANSLAIQFWLDSKTVGSGTLLSQKDGPQISLNGKNITFSLAGESISTMIDDSQYNFYSFVYRDGTKPYLEIIQNGDVLETKLLSQELTLSSNHSVFIGGTNIEGNLHDLRLWSIGKTSTSAAAEKDKTLSGKEIGLVGYWPLDEGHGIVGHDKVRNKNAKVNLNWSIKPKTESYEFKNGEYLVLDKVGSVSPTNSEDITVSFWIKATSGDTGTVFSNGLGTDNIDEPKLTNGYRNKWSLDLNSTGNLVLITEGIEYDLTSSSIADDNWHHIAFIVKRRGSLNSYVDGVQKLSVSSENIGGIAGSKLALGAKLNQPLTGATTYNNIFTGKLDEFRIWNAARSYEQIKRDRYFELDRETIGLLLYANFKKEDANLVTKGPRYNVRKGDGTTESYLSLLGAGTTQNFAEDSPAIKPALNLTNVPLTTVINGDEIILNPTLTTELWSLYEGQILDITIARMIDVHFNEQLSPVTFSAFVNRQEMEWYTDAGTKVIKSEISVNQPYSFTMDVINKGGNNQNYIVKGLPNWMKVSSISGSVSPTATKQLTFTVDQGLAMGTYSADLFLKLENGYNDRLDFNLRVLQEAPDWSVDPADYSNSMNVISQIKIDNDLVRDKYTKVGAFVNGDPRGEAYLQYDDSYDSYYAFLTIHSNVSSSEEVTFKIWDAVNGKTLVANLNGNPSTTFLQNEVIGTKSNPAIFSAGNLSEQRIDLNEGWTWISFYVKDVNFDAIDDLFAQVNLSGDDLIKSKTAFAQYENSRWNGNLGSFDNKQAYKIRLQNASTLVLTGNAVKEEQINIPIKIGWNWLSYPIHRSVSISEAFAYYDATDGDLIKDQYSFAIYDRVAGEWSGSLKYLQPDRGYMLKSGKAQTLNYPNVDFVSKNNRSIEVGQEHTQDMISNFAKYAQSMSIIAEVVDDEVFTHVKIYDHEGALRGSSEIIDENGRQLAYITVHSDVSQELKYVLVNETKQVEIANSFEFVTDGLIGSLAQPIVLGQNSEPSRSLLFDEITLYPNPFNNELRIDIANTNIQKAFIYNAMGSQVLEINITSQLTKVDTQNLSTGIYFLRLVDENGQDVVRKLIKK